MNYRPSPRMSKSKAAQIAQGFGVESGGQVSKAAKTAGPKESSKKKVLN